MTRFLFASPLVAALAAAAFASPASAAPAVSPASPSHSDSLAQPVACWWRHGVRVCDGFSARRHGYRTYGYRTYGYGPSYGYRPSYGYSYGAPRPEDLRFGSTEWWRAMDREGRGGYRR